MAFENLTIIIPTLNEESSIAELITILLEYYPKSKIIICDDGSTDKTQGIVRSFKSDYLKLIDRTEKHSHGLTASVIDGIKESKTEYSIVIDADLQHPPKKIMYIYSALNARYDLVIGVRSNIKVRWSISRRITSAIATILAQIRLTYGEKLPKNEIPKIKNMILKQFKIFLIKTKKLLLERETNDPLSGYFGFNTELIKNIIQDNIQKFELKGYKILFDILKNTPHEIKITDVRYSFSLRGHGKSNLGKKQMFSFIRSLFK